MLDILGLESYQQRPLDGMSLLPVLGGEITERPIANGATHSGCSIPPV